MNPFLTPVVRETTARGRIYRAPEMADDYPEWTEGSGGKFTMGLALSVSEIEILERHGHEPFSFEVE